MAITGLDINLTVGAFAVNRLPKGLLVSERGAVAERCVLELPDTEGRIAAGVKVGDPVELYFGYRGGPNQTWRGQVISVKSLVDRARVQAQSPELAFIKTKVSECFHQETARGVVRRLMAMAKVAPGRIEGPDEVFPHLIFSGQPVFQCFRQINESLERVFKLNLSAMPFWIGANRTGSWGDFNEPGPIPIMASGDNLVCHDPKGEDGTVTALLCPGLRHSQLFTVRDDRRTISFTKRSQSVTHHLGERNNLTIVTYGLERGYA